MKRAITGIVAASLTLGTMAPAAFAATTSAPSYFKNTISVGSYNANVQGIKVQDAGNTTALFPFFYIQSGLNALGYKVTWDGVAKRLDITTPSGVTLDTTNLNPGVGAAGIYINGTLVQRAPFQVANDMGGNKKPTSFMAAYYLNQALAHVGLVNHYDGAAGVWKLWNSDFSINGGDSIAIGGKDTLSLTSKSETVDASKVTWSLDSAAAGKAFLDAAGNFTATSAGTYTVTANFDGNTFTKKIAVYGTAAGLQITGTSDMVANTASNETVTLTAVDANGNAVLGYTGSANVSLGGSTDVEFDTTAAGQTAFNATGTNAVTFKNGVATVVVKSTSAVAGTSATVTATSADIKDANGNLVSATATIKTVAQVATSVSVKPTSTSLQDNSATSEEVDVQVVDQAGQPMLWGSFPVSVAVSGQGTMSEGTSNSYTTAYVGNGSTTNEVKVHVSTLTGQPGPIVVSATSTGLTGGSATINAATVGDASAIKLAVSSGSAASFDADHGVTGASFDVTNVDKSGNTVTPLSGYTVTAKDASGNDAIAGSEVSASVTAGVLQVTGTKAGTYTVTVADPAGKLTSASTTVTITAGAAAKVAITSPALSTVNVSQANPATTVTAQIEDASNNAVSESGVAVEFTAAQSGGSGASWTLNGSKTGNYIVNTDASGKASVKFASQATAGLVWTVGIDKVGTTVVSPTPVTVDVVGMDPASLTVATTNASAAATTYFKSGATVTYTVTEKDAYGNLYPATDRINVTVPAGMTVPGSGGPSGSASSGYYVTLSGGTATFNLVAGTAGVEPVTVSDASAVNTNLSATANVSVSADTQSKVTFLNGAKAITSTNPLVVDANKPVAIQLVPTDNAGNVAVSASPLYYSLSDAAEGGYFTAVSGGAPVTNVTIPAGSTGITLYYVNATASGSAGYYNFSATPVAVPADPSLTATPGAAASKQITVSWSAVSGATSYNVSYSLNGGTTWSAPVSQTGLSYTYTGTASSQAVEFKVTSTGYAGTSTGATVSSTTP